MKEFDSSQVDAIEALLKDGVPAIETGEQSLTAAFGDRSITPVDSVVDSDGSTTIDETLQLGGGNEAFVVSVGRDGDTSGSSLLAQINGKSAASYQTTSYAGGTLSVSTGATQWQFVEMDANRGFNGVIRLSAPGQGASRASFTAESVSGVRESKAHAISGMFDGSTINSLDTLRFFETVNNGTVRAASYKVEGVPYSL